MSRGLGDFPLPSSGSQRPEEATQRFRKRSGSKSESGSEQGSSHGGRQPQLPTSGDQVFGFGLRQELGRGAFARVFLADQAELGGRPVVLKVSGIDGDEPQTLAQLQHTHIVPIYSVHEDITLGLRAVCMPYFGGASLSQVLEKVWAENTRPSRGDELIRALGQVGAPPPNAVREGVEAEPTSPCATGITGLETLTGLNYDRACAWVVARLAEALQHAHDRGVIHRDIKPSNILVSSDGQPMLLDFNVATNTRDTSNKVVLGGTVAYMSPEHLQAMTNKETNREIRTDHRSDIYSLGMVLYEMLAGVRPFEHTGSYSPVMPQLLAMALERSQLVPSLRKVRPGVSWNLEGIIRKTLMPDPSQRYQHAGQVAEDLRCFLDDLPLKYAPELSFREKSSKWLRRHPRLTSSGTVATLALALLAAGAVAFAGVRRHLHEAETSLSIQIARSKQRAYESGIVRALCLVNTTSDLADHKRQGQKECEETLAVYGVLQDDEWQSRAGWEYLDREERRRLSEDTRELLMLLAWSRAAEAKGPDSARASLAILDKAEAIKDLPPSRALLVERAHYLKQLGEDAAADEELRRAETLPPTSARDYHLLASHYTRRGEFAQAIEQLDHALERNPRHYWSVLQRGICYEEMKEYSRAEGDFGVCIGLWPEFAWGHFNRGVVRGLQGNRLAAIKDYTAALRCDPDFVPALLNRGIAQLEEKLLSEALTDLKHVVELGRDEAGLHASMGVAYEGLGRFQEANEAFARANKQAEQESEDVWIRTRWAQGFAVIKRSPTEARDAFEAVLEKRPNDPQALYGRSMVLVTTGHLNEAITALTAAIDGAPHLMEARCFRATLRARAGRFQEALEDVNLAFREWPREGAPHYSAACVFALWLSRITSPADIRATMDKALDYLEKALAMGYGKELIKDDEDLKALQGEPRFKALQAR